jgi:hypothetical protein
MRGALLKVGSLVLLIAIALWNPSCDNNDTASTSQYGRTITQIVWPDKYQSNVSGSFTIRVSVHIPDGAPGVYCWARDYHRLDPTDDNAVVDDTTQLTSVSATHLFSLDYRQGGSGIYTVHVGIAESEGAKFHPEQAEEWFKYQFYVDEDYYYDADVEYHYQVGCDLFSSSWPFQGTVAQAFKGTRVCFNFVELGSNLPNVPVTHTHTAMLAYRQLVGSYWDPGDYDKPIYKYFLAGVTDIVNDSVDTLLPGAWPPQSTT